MRILVVDDHPPTVELMRLTLTSFGHSVRCASTVATALQAAGADRPDVIISDLTFGSTKETGEDGLALARAIRADRGPARVGMLAVTGVVSPVGLQAALDSGFDRVLVKPFDIENLVEQIEAVGHERLDG